MIRYVTVRMELDATRDLAAANVCQVLGEINVKIVSIFLLLLLLFFFIWHFMLMLLLKAVVNFRLTTFPCSFKWSEAMNHIFIWWTRLWKLTSHECSSMQEGCIQLADASSRKCWGTDLQADQKVLDPLIDWCYSESFTQCWCCSCPFCYNSVQFCASWRRKGWLVTFQFICTAWSRSLSTFVNIWSEVEKKNKDANYHLILVELRI